MVYPALGKPLNEETNQTTLDKAKQTILETKKTILEELGEDLVTLFKKVFGHSREDQREDFLTDPFIKQIWPKIIQEVPQEFVFKRGPIKEADKRMYMLMT